MPSMPGIIRSSTTTSIGWLSMTFSASVPSLAVSVASPCECRPEARTLLTRSESSTTRTRMRPLWQGGRRPAIRIGNEAVGGMRTGGPAPGEQGTGPPRYLGARLIAPIRPSAQ